MCRLLHVEWRCNHTQNIWQYCRDATAPSRTPSAAEQTNTPCEDFVSKYGATPNGPTADEYRNFCCLEDQAPIYKQVLELESALGIKPKESLPHIPSFFLNRQQKALKGLRRKFQSLAKRHEERCEALYYGLRIVEESDTYRAPADERWKRPSEDSAERESEDKIQTTDGFILSSRRESESDPQTRQSGEQASEVKEVLRGGDKAQEPGALEGNRT